MLIFNLFFHIFQFFKKDLKHFFKNCFKYLSHLLQYEHKLVFIFSFTKLSSKQKESGQIPIVKMSKKGDFENPKVLNRSFSTKSVPN